jgi:hypothetical protein
LLGEELLVGGGVEQGLVVLLAELDLDHPAALPGILGDDFEVVLDGRVDLDDLAAQGRVEVRDGLDGLDLAEGLAGLEDAADLGQVAVDEVALVAALELLDGEVGDADDADVTGDLDPLVGVQVLAVVGAHGPWGPWVRRSGWEELRESWPGQECAASSVGGYFLVRE